MRKLSVSTLLTLLATFTIVSGYSQTRTNTAILRNAATIQAEKERILADQLKSLAAAKGWETVIQGKNGNIAILVGVDPFGLPQYLITENNIVAAATIGTTALWPGGSSGLNLSGSSNSVKNKLAVWDGGRVKASHVELTGRVVQRDNPSSISDHSTHVAGTMIASGVNPLAKGMSFGQQELVAYDFSNHTSEMFTEAPNLLVSNHSYGAIAGWSFNEGQNRWEFWGQFGANEDYKMGYYSSETQLFDSMAYNAPYYLIVKSSGNKRNENGPAVGAAYWRFDAGGTMNPAGNRPAGISNNDGYDIIPTYGTAKNILTVGAVNPIPNGYTRPSDVTMSAFSSWGPTDDGRIKPDVVANGVNLLSSIAGSNDNSYAIFSGTSMATPNASGSLLLLQEYYNQLHSTFMRSATLKGLIIHTADESGAAPGPDYQNGWGLINMKNAAAVITSNNTGHRIQESVLNNTATFSLPVVASGNGKIVATISWTDPKAEQIEPVATALNNNTRKLVNDLDIVIRKGTAVYRPWVLNPASPGSAATTGDNVLDNVEKVELENVIAGESYTIEVTHKGTLARGTQAFSLIVSGVGGTAYCASNPTSTAGARIDSVSFATIQQKNTPGCTSYSSFTNITGAVQPSQTLPIFIRLNSCDATTADKIVKVYIDGNNDGDFTDAGENVATSGVINGNGDFTGNVIIPAGLTPGKTTRLRIVMQETSNAADVNPCGTYTRGETQDYTIVVNAAANDFGVAGVISPSAADCGSGEQYLTIRIRNYGTADRSGIPVTATVTQGATTIVTLNGTYPGTVAAGAEVAYTFQAPFVLAGGTSYTITSSTIVANDQNPANNQNVTNITTSANSPNPTGTATICGPTAVLKVTAPTAELYNWYTSPTATTPIAVGPTATTSTIAPTYYLSKNETGKLGAANKMVFTEGGYNTFNNNIVKFTTSGAVSIKTARLYIGHPGKLNLILRRVVQVNADGSYNYFPVSTTTIDVYATAPTPPVINTQNNDPNDPGAIYYLGLDFPQAGDYYLLIQCLEGSTIFRNNLIPANPYPYTIPGVISLTGNSATDPGDPLFWQKFYYFYYDMAVKLPVCPSARVPIVPTTAVAPTISLAGNVLTSSSAIGNQWFRNGSPIGGAIFQTYTATESGTYRVESTDAGGCTLQSNEIVVSITSVPNVDPSEIALVVSPNPNRGEFNLQLETITKSDLLVTLLNSVGQKVYGFTKSDFIGRLSQPVNAVKLPAGVYYLQVHHDQKMYIRKIVIAP